MKCVYLLALILPFSSCGERQADPPSNLLLITIDTLRYDRLGCTGHEKARTPVLDGLAREGALLDCMIVTTPITLPSHASIMTGLHPHDIAVRDNRPFSLSDKAETLAEVLKGRGFQTAAVISGETLAPGCGLEQGFDAYLFKPLPRPSRIVLAETTADRTTALALEAAGGMEAEKPFFLWVHYFDPHFPYEPPGSFASSFEHPYDGEVAFVDQQIGILLNGLRANGMLDETLVAVTSDHGEGLGEHGEPTHGFYLYDSTIRVPFILKGPGVAFKGRWWRPLPAVYLKEAFLGLLFPREYKTYEADGHTMPETPPVTLISFLRGERNAYVLGPAYSESLYCYRSFRWAQMTSIREREGKLIRGGRDEFFELFKDPSEQRPVEAPAPIATRMDQWKKTAKSRFDQGAEFQKDLPGYFGGTLGRGGAFIQEEANRALPHPPDRSSAVNRLLRAVDLSASGGTNQARMLLEGLVEEDPDNPAALYWLARVLRDQGEAEGSPALIQKAYAFFQKTLAMDPESADAFHMGVWCLLQIGDFEKAKEALDDRTSAGKDGAKTWELLGYLHGHRVSAGRVNPFFDLEKAFLCFDRSLEGNKNNPLLLQKAAELCKKHDREALQEHYLRMLDGLNSGGWR